MKAETLSLPDTPPSGWSRNVEWCGPRLSKISKLNTVQGGKKMYGGM